MNIDPRNLDTRLDEHEWQAQERAMREAINREHGAMTLWVVKGNDRACRFYERLGFAPDGAARSNTRFLRTPFDELRYRKALSAHEQRHREIG